MIHGDVVDDKEVGMAKQLVLLTYTPRELSEDEYAKFIREIDYPAFRQNPHIIDYSCWRVAESLQGGEQFTHFDLMAVDDLANWQAIVSDPVIAGNVERWTKDWSRHGPDHADQSENLKISFCHRYWG